MADNPYIRTYAKDVAALQGKEPPPSPTTSGPTPAPAAPTQEDAERQAVLDRLRERAAKDPVHQSEMLPRSLPTPLPKVEAVGSDLPPEPPPPPAPVVVAPPPLPPSPAPIRPEPVPPPEPLTILPPTPPKPAPLAPPPPPPPAPTPVSAEASPIHTYKSDFSDHIDKQEASTFSVLAAQSDAGKLTTAPVKKTRAHSTGPIFAAAGVALIVLAGGGVFAAYRYVTSHSAVALTPSIPSLVFADDRQAVTGEGADLIRAIAASAEVPLGDGQVRVLYLTQASTTPDGKTVMVPLAGGRLIGSLQLSAPDILLRNVAPESTVGVVHAGDETRAFFILKVLSYERTFAGMLQWEPTMERALAVLYPEFPIPDVPPATGTSTPTAPLSTAPPRFVDEVTSNHDVRALKDAQGRTIFLYGYKDKEILVLARNEAAFAELINRLSATKEQ